MEKMAIDQLLADVERLKSNIKECDDILRTLREIQRNYSSAVSEPKQLLDELHSAVEQWEQQRRESLEKEQTFLKSKEKEYSALQSLIQQRFDEFIAALKETEKGFSERETALLCSTEERCSHLLERIQQAIDQVQGLIQDFHLINDQLCSKIELIFKNSKTNKRESRIGMIFSLSAAVLSLICIILSAVL